MSIFLSEAMLSSPIKINETIPENTQPNIDDAGMTISNKISCTFFFNLKEAATETAFRLHSDSSSSSLLLCSAYSLQQNGQCVDCWTQLCVLG